MPELELGEWDVRDPSTDPVLAGLDLDEPGVGDLASRLAGWGALHVIEERRGLRVQSRQHVGVVQLGALRIRIRPKVPLVTLWRLMVYGLGLDALPPLPPVDIGLTGNVPELLVEMLRLEAERLWQRGLSRGYRDRDDWLGAPRGRPDLTVLARNLPLTRAALPCRHHVYTADVLHNHVVLAGLLLARRLTSSRRLRGALHRTIESWRSVCAEVPIGRSLLDDADRSRTRLTAHYAPAHRLVRALFERLGPDERLAGGSASVGGALWNMATLFERAVARFLCENLPDLEVHTQSRLHRVYSVEPGPHGHRAPTPRPDLVVMRDGEPLAVLDTKYRDLSATSLPRDIVYQMSVYSLAFGGQRPVPAIVLYAVPHGSRPDVRFTLRVTGGEDRRIVLRAVPLDGLIAALDSGSPATLAAALVAT